MLEILCVRSAGLLLCRATHRHHTVIPFGEVRYLWSLCVDGADVIVANEGSPGRSQRPKQKLKQSSLTTTVPKRLHHLSDKGMRVRVEVKQHVSSLALSVTGQQLQMLRRRLVPFSRLALQPRDLNRKNEKKLDTT